MNLKKQHNHRTIHKYKQYTLNINIYKHYIDRIKRIHTVSYKAHVHCTPKLKHHIHL